jgi:ATPase subunit of ABC transporter with duplicated ATPase domains
LRKERYESKQYKSEQYKAHGLSHTYDGELLFRDAEVVLHPGDRIGLVGPNGVGKSTLLRLLAGAERPQTGQVTRAPHTTVGFFTHQRLDGVAARGGLSLGAYLAEGLGELHAVRDRMSRLETRLAETGGGDGGDGGGGDCGGDDGGAERAADLLAEYGAVQERWTALSGWTADSRIAEIRDRLGIAHLPADTPLGSLSGGEQARVLLGRTLLGRPDVLFLDEPTNHLDADGTVWLGRYLEAFPGAVFVATHDRAFLDAAVSRIVELDGIHEEPQHYPGGYTAYRAEKARRWEALLLDYEAQEKYRRRLEEDIERTKGHALGLESATRDSSQRRYAKKVAKKAKAREQRLQRQMDGVRWIAEPQTRPELVLAFPGAAERRGEAVLTAAGLSLKLGGTVLLDQVDLRVEAGDRVVIGGPNGAGKTTLLRVLTGELAPDAGSAAAHAPVGVLAQSLAAVPARTSVIDFFRSRVPVYIDQAERLLTGYLFGPDDWDRALGELSAGQVRRLLLAALVNSGAEVLVLDEPTNFLDFDALDVVEEALRAYQGTLVVVSHDAYFLDRVLGVAAPGRGPVRRWQVGAGSVAEG